MVPAPHLLLAMHCEASVLLNHREQHLAHRFCGGIRDGENHNRMKPQRLSRLPRPP